MAFAATRDADSAPFFDATAEGRLLVRRCAGCGHHLAPDARTCHRCGGSELGWVEAAGTGSLVSWTIVHRRTSGVAADGDGPAVLGLVELDEGPWLSSPLLGVDPTAIAVGDRLRVTFVRPGDGEAIPAFVPS